MYLHDILIDIKKVDKQLNVVYGTIRYERCSRNPLSGPLLFIYNNMYLSYIYIDNHYQFLCTIYTKNKIIYLKYIISTFLVILCI